MRQARDYRGLGVYAAALAGVLGVAAPAMGQLRPDEVLVVYDSRIPDSLAVAERYAGSGKVPGGVGGLAGHRPGVRVFDLASSGAPVLTAPTITPSQFGASLRGPIRAHLTGQNLTQRVRCLVVTKGMPHRVQDHDVPIAGDNPTLQVDEILAGDATAASVDAELTLVYADLDAGEQGGTMDSRADGLIVNPFWRTLQPHRVYPQTNILSPKNYSAFMPGPAWVPTGSGATRLMQGDVLLVCRLDGNSVADVDAALTRAGRVFYDTLAHVALFDESGSNGVADAGPNDELDNVGSGFSACRDTDDYEITRDEFATDTRFAGSFVRYNALLGSSQFFVGPRLTWQPPVLLVNEPVVLVASYGANHFGLPLTTGGEIARTIYARSYHYPDGAIMNTIESYNARSLGGIPPLDFAPQMHVGDFIEAGGTFAIGHVWEPLADTIADNRFLARHFIRGNFSWAEAAWSSIPALSWQHVVLGDPLARSVRSSEDITGDQRITVDDLYAWEASPSDVDRNGVTDANDRAHVVRALRAWERADVLTGRD